MNSKKEALKDCIERIEHVIKKMNFKIRKEELKKELSEFICPIDRELLTDPVTTNCGHLFNQAGIVFWKKQSNPCLCPLCRIPIKEITPINELRQYIQRRLSDPAVPVITFDDPTKLNKSLAAEFLGMAKKCIDAKRYTDALDYYKKALQCSDSVAVYLEIPWFYDQIRDTEKATLSRYHLSLYHLKKTQTQLAVQALENCNATSLAAVITVLSNPSVENIIWAMSVAQNQTDTKESIFIYKQIIALAPTQWNAYQKLISLTKNSKEKRALAIKASELAHSEGQFELAADFHKAGGIQITSQVISGAQWADASTIVLPPYPPDLQEFLKQDCVIWTGKKREETHFVVPLFPNVDLNDNGKCVPFTPDTQEQLQKKSGGPGYLHFYGNKLLGARSKFGYGVMTKGVIPGSKALTRSAKLKLLNEARFSSAGYKYPPFFNAIRAIFWEKQRSGRCYFSKDPLTYTYCEEGDDNGRLVVGALSDSGLIVVRYTYDLASFGVAGWREF